MSLLDCQLSSVIPARTGLLIHRPESRSHELPKREFCDVSDCSSGVGSMPPRDDNPFLKGSSTDVQLKVELPASEPDDIRLYALVQLTSGSRQGALQPVLISQPLQALLDGPLGSAAESRGFPV